VLFVAAAMCLMTAALGAYGRYAVLDEGHFADRATNTLRSDEVEQEVARRFSGRLLAAHPDLAPGTVAIEDAFVTGMSGDPAFRAGFHAAAARLHRAIFSDPDADASLVVAGSGSALRDGLAMRLPLRANTLPVLEDPPLMSIGSNHRERLLRELAPVAKSADLPVTLAFGIAALALLGLGAAWAGGRRGIWGAGLTVAAAGGLIGAGVTGARDVVLSHFDTGFGDAVVSQIWTAFLGDLRTWGLAACAAGLVVAAAAGAPRLDPRALLVRPKTDRGRLTRAGILVAVAAMAVKAPELVLHLTLVTLAAGLVYVASGDLLRVLAPPRGTAHRLRAATTAAVLLTAIAVAALPVH
jgi:hypothetical protein